MNIFDRLKYLRVIMKKTLIEIFQTKKVLFKKIISLRINNETHVVLVLVIN